MSNTERIPVMIAIKEFSARYRPGHILKVPVNITIGSIIKEVYLLPAPKTHSEGSGTDFRSSLLRYLPGLNCSGFSTWREIALAMK